jgi:hypothetical protein
MIKNSLKKDVPESLAFDDVVENITRTPQVWVHHTEIARIPTRGILVTSRRRVVLENNVFDRVRMNAVLIEDDAESWYESGPVQNVAIRNNHFIRCGSAVISIHPENGINDKPVHKNIAITGNQFDLTGDSKVLYAKSTSGIDVSGNKIKSGATAIGELTEFKDCLDIKLTENQIIKP